MSIPTTTDLRRMLDDVESNQGGPIDAADPSVMRELGDIEARRQRVLTLRLNRMTETAIAGILGVSQPTVSVDMQYWRERWQANYGGAPAFDPSLRIGETIALYEELESMALNEFTRRRIESQEAAMPADDGVGQPPKRKRKAVNWSPSQLMSCLRTALMARAQQIALLQDTGLLDRKIGSVNVSGIEDAATITARLRQLSIITEDMMVSDGERAWLGEIPEKTETSRRRSR